jgi:hypothetical protein
LHDTGASPRTVQAMFVKASMQHLPHQTLSFNFSRELFFSSALLYIQGMMFGNAARLILTILATCGRSGSGVETSMTRSDQGRVLGKAGYAATCVKRCAADCRGKKNVQRCADRFVTDRCFPFSARIRNKVKTQCVVSLKCQFCEKGFKCTAPGQCCADIDCARGQRCLGNVCAAKGNPVLTLLWKGGGTFLF